MTVVPYFPGDTFPIWGFVGVLHFVVCHHTCDCSHWDCCLPCFKVSAAPLPPPTFPLPALTLFHEHFPIPTCICFLPLFLPAFLPFSPSLHFPIPRLCRPSLPYPTFGLGQGQVGWTVGWQFCYQAFLSVIRVPFLTVCSCPHSVLLPTQRRSTFCFLHTTMLYLFYLFLLHLLLLCTAFLLLLPTLLRLNSATLHCFLHFCSSHQGLFTAIQLLDLLLFVLCGHYSSVIGQGQACLSVIITDFPGSVKRYSVVLGPLLLQGDMLLPEQTYYPLYKITFLLPALLLPFLPLYLLLPAFYSVVLFSYFSSLVHCCVPVLSYPAFCPYYYYPLCVWDFLFLPSLRYSHHFTVVLLLIEHICYMHSSFTITPCMHLPSPSHYIDRTFFLLLLVLLFLFYSQFPILLYILIFSHNFDFCLPLAFHYHTSVPATCAFVPHTLGISFCAWRQRYRRLPGLLVVNGVLETAGGPV